MSNVLFLHFWFAVLLSLLTFGQIADDFEEGVNYLFYAMSYCLGAGLLLWFWDSIIVPYYEEEEE